MDELKIDDPGLREIMAYQLLLNDIGEIKNISDRIPYIVHLLINEAFSWNF